MQPDLMRGDIVCVRGEGWISRKIRQFTRGIGEEPAHINHVGMISQDGSLRSAMLVEALHRTRRWPLAEAYKGKQAHIEVWRKRVREGESDLTRELTAAEMDALSDYAESQVGKKYGYGKIALHALDYGISWVTRLFTRKDPYVFRRLAFMRRYPICSWIVAYAYAKVLGVRFLGRSPRVVTPDDIHDHLVRGFGRGQWVRVAEIETE